MQYRGGLGNGQNNSQSVSTPELIRGLPPIASLSCASHCLAVDRDGGVWAWGFNNRGQVGDGTTSDRATPARVAGLSRIVLAKAMGFHSLAIDTGGAVWGWGNNVSHRIR